MTAAGTASAPVTELRHGKITLALHHLRAADPRSSTGTLLLLHGLGEQSPASVPPHLTAWFGDVWALDFTGHGRSTTPAGGGYTCEVLMADADAALAHLGPLTVLGRGLGAYVALLLAGARAAAVRGAILTDGPGLVGGGIGPGAPRVTLPAPWTGNPDPFALAELSVDVRPPDYAVTYGRLAVQGSACAEPITVSGVVRPPWLDALVDLPGVVCEPLPAALARYS